MLQAQQKGTVPKRLFSLILGMSMLKRILLNMYLIAYTMTVQIQKLLDENRAWEEEESKKGDATYWNQRKCLELQIDGVYDGYMMANEGKPERVL